MNRRRDVTSIAAIVVLALSAGVLPAGVDEPAGRTERDITYAVVGGVSLALDVYYPAVSNAPAPLAVYIHGGGWTGGDKGGGAGLLDRDELLARGYVVASINYRLAPAYRWPAQVEDCKAAIRFLRANAARFGVDPQRVGIWGGSAGGHLVAMLGVADAGAGFDDSGGSYEQSSRVLAVADLFGPADLSQPGFAASSAVQALLGPNPSPEALSSASPVTYVSPDDPPFLILHGDKDTTVPLSQSEILRDRLDAADVPVTLVVVRNAGHGFTPSGGLPVPSRSELTSMIAEFFDSHVKNAPRVRRHVGVARTNP